MTEKINDSSIQSILISGLFFAFIGETGCGKTACMTWYAFQIHNRLREMKLLDDVKLYVNFHLKDSKEQNYYWDYQYLDHPDKMLEINSGFIFADEIWGWCLDSYDSRTLAQKKYDKLMGRGRKRGLSIFASSQRFLRIDPNFRYNVQYLVFPELHFINNKPSYIDVHVVNNHNDIIEDHFILKNLDILFNLYDTREEILHLDEISDIDYKALAKQFIEWNKIEIVNQNNQVMEIPQTVTQDLVNLFLSEKKIIRNFTREQRKMIYIAVLRNMENVKGQ